MRWIGKRGGRQAGRQAGRQRQGIQAVQHAEPRAAACAQQRQQQRRRRQQQAPHIYIRLGAKGGRHGGRHAGVEALLDLQGGMSGSNSDEATRRLEAVDGRAHRKAMQLLPHILAAVNSAPAAGINTALRGRQKQHPTLVPAAQRPLYASHPFICGQATWGAGTSAPSAAPSARCRERVLEPELKTWPARMVVSKGIAVHVSPGWLAGWLAAPSPGSWRLRRRWRPLGRGGSSRASQTWPDPTAGRQAGRRAGGMSPVG